MTILVTGSSGHLGEALVRTLKAQGREVIGIDVRPGAFTHRVGSIVDRAFVRGCVAGQGEKRAGLATAPRFCSADRAARGRRRHLEPARARSERQGIP